MVRLLPGETKVSWAENSDTVSRDGEDDSGTDRTTVAPPRGTLLWAEDRAGWVSRWWSEEDQELHAGCEEEEAGACWALLYKEARRASQELQRSSRGEDEGLRV